MADVESNIHINIDTSDSIAAIKSLQAQISSFHTQMAKGGAAANAASSQLQQGLINSINATGNFTAQMKNIKTTTESFTTALEKNKLSMGEYFRYAGASTKTFGKLFSSEFDTINKVARERVKDLQTQYIKLGRDANGALKSIAVRPLTLDLKDMGTQTAIAAQKQQLFNQLVTQGSTNLLNFGKNTQWAGRQLMVGFTVPLSIFGATAAKEFMKLEEQVIRFKRVYGDTFTSSAETDKMIRQVRTLADEFTKYGVAVEKTIGLAADAAAMGKTGADLISQVNQASRLAVLGGVDQQAALETTTSLTNAFGVSADQLAGKINFLNAVENQTVTSISDLTEAIPKAGPVVQQLGGNVEDLAFFLTAMKEGGINASEGANALKSGLASIINPTSQATDMLNGFGINLKGIVDADKGNVKKTIIDLGLALDKLEPTNRARAIETLFGKFQFARMSTLFQNVIAEGSQANKVLALTNQSSEALAVLSERELGKIQDSPMYKFKGAVEDFKASMVPVGEAFLKAVTPIVEFGTKILDKFNEMGDGAKNFTVLVTAIVAAVGPVLLMTFGLVANGVANIIKMFMGLKNIFSGVGGSSQILGEQTSYMTQTQIEAAAVAASLDQSHNKLSQTFTSEASAIRQLVGAYDAAIAKQAVFAGTSAVGGRGVKPKKFATGGVVPGSGSGDTVPAMLTPGETVIPAAQSKKYGSLINGIIAGKIPGFANGKMAAGVTGGMTSLEALSKGMVATFTNAVTLLDKLTNQRLKAGVDSKALGTEVKTRGAGMNAPIVEAVARSLGASNTNDVIKMLEARPELRQFAQNISDGVASEISTKVGKIDDAAFGKIYQSVAKQEAAKGGFGKAVDKFFTEKTTFEDTTMQRQSQSGRLRAMGRATIAEGSPSYRSKSNSYGKIAESLGMDPKGTVMAHTTDREFMSLDKAANGRNLTNQAKAAAARMMKSVEAGAVEGINKAAQSASPSKKAQQSGKNIADGAVLGINEGVKPAKQAGKRVGAAAAQGVSETDTTGDMTGGVPAKGKGKLGKMVGRAGGIGLAVSGAAAMASMMPGGIGDVASQIAGPLTAISSVASIAPMLEPLIPLIANPVGGVIAAVGALVVAGFALKGAFDTARDKAMELANTMGSGSQSMDTLSKFAGTVTAGQVMDKRRANAMSPFQVVEGQTSFGDSFMQDAGGKALIDGLKEQLKSSPMKDVQKQLVNQMMTAVASGALNPEQARSVIASLGQQLGDTNFSINATAQLNKLIGPNGEDLKNDPVGVRIKILGDTQKQLAASMGNVGVSQSANVAANAIKNNPWVTGTMGIPGVSQIVAEVTGSIAFVQNLGTATGAVVAQGVMALQQQQEMLDSLQLDYDKRIAIATAAGDTVKAEKLTNEYILGRQALLEQNAKTISLLGAGYAKSDVFTQGAMGQNVDKAIETQYKDNPLAQQVAIGARDKIVSAGALTNQQEYVMKLTLASGDIDPAMMDALMTNFGENKPAMEGVLNLITNLGTAEGNRALQIMNMFQDSEGNPRKEQQAQFLANFEGKNTEEATKYLDMFTAVSKVGNVQDLQVIMDFYLKNPDAGKEVMADVDKLKKAQESGPITLDIIQNLYNPDVANTVRDNWDYFSKLDKNMQITYTQTLLTIYKTRGTKEYKQGFKAWYQEKGMKGYSKLDTAGKSSVMSQYENEAAQKVTETTKQNQGVNPPVEQTSSGGGGGGGTAKKPPVAQYIQDQEKITGTINNQVISIRKLTAAGATYTEAMYAASDADTAAAIARSNNADEIANIVAKTKEATNATKAYSAAQKVAASNQEYVDQQKTIANLMQNPLGLSPDAVAAIANSQDLQTLYNDLLSNPTVDPKILETALNQALNKTEVELNIKKLKGISGWQEIFQDGFSKAMEAFAAKQKSIEIEFKSKKDPFEKIIKAGQQAISDLQNSAGGMDDLNADLDRITEKERDINKAYDDQLKALDQIEKVNADIAKQKKTQLTIADALSQGDISAAAKAVEDLRAQKAADALADQRAQLDKSREIQLANLTGGLGLNREQIEKRIRSIKADILEIEENIIEPAQRQVELLDRQQQTQIDSLTVLGKTKDEWEKIQNGIDVARVNSNSYTKAMNEALGIVSKITNYWTELDGKKVTVTLDVVQPNQSAYTMPADNTGGGGGGGDTTTDNTTSEDTTTTAPSADSRRSATAQPKPQKNFLEEMFSGLEQQGWYQSLMAIGETFSEAFRVGVEKIKTWWETNIAQPISQWWAENVQPKIDAFATKFNEVMTNVKTWWHDNVEKPVNDTMTKIKDWWETHIAKPFNEVVLKVKGWWKEHIEDPIKGFFDWFFGSSTIEQKKKDIQAFITDVKGKFDAWQEGVKTFWAELPGKIGAWFSSLPGLIGGWFGTIGANVAGAVKGAVNGIFDTMRGVSILGWKPFTGLPRLYASGGLVAGSDGKVRGTGNKDSIPAMLTPGEFIIKKSMVNRYGLGLLEDINSGRFGKRGTQSSKLQTKPSFNKPVQGGIRVPRPSVPQVPVSHIMQNLAINDSFRVPQMRTPSFSEPNAFKLDAIRQMDAVQAQQAMDSSVYNNSYSVSVNAQTNASADEIADLVMQKINRVNQQQLRGNRF